MRQASETANEHRIGYARVSTVAQNINSQIDALYAFGCKKVFSDKESGVKTERPGWQQLMDYIREGDSVVITELSRMTRSLKHLLQVVEDLDKKGVGIVSLREHIDTSTATGRCFISIMGAVSQMERELKSERAAAGREAAKAREKQVEGQRQTPKSLSRLEYYMKTLIKQPRRFARQWAWEGEPSSVTLLSGREMLKLKFCNLQGNICFGNKSKENTSW